MKNFGRPEQFLKVWRKIRNVREKISGKMYGKKSRGSKILATRGREDFVKFYLAPPKMRVAPQMPPPKFRDLAPPLISVFYPHFSVLSPFQCFIPIAAFYPHFSVLSPFQCFIPISAFYPHFSVLSPFQRCISISAFYPHFSFRFQFPFQPFSLNVLSRSDEKGYPFLSIGSCSDKTEKGTLFYQFCCHSKRLVRVLNFKI